MIKFVRNILKVIWDNSGNYDAYDPAGSSKSKAKTLLKQYQKVISSINPEIRILEELVNQLAIQKQDLKNENLIAKKFKDFEEFYDNTNSKLCEIKVYIENIRVNKHVESCNRVYKLKILITNILHIKSKFLKNLYNLAKYNAKNSNINENSYDQLETNITSDNIIQKELLKTNFTTDNKSNEINIPFEKNNKDNSLKYSINNITNSEDSDAIHHKTTKLSHLEQVVDSNRIKSKITNSSEQSDFKNKKIGTFKTNETSLFQEDNELYNNLYDVNNQIKAHLINLEDNLIFSNINKNSDHMNSTIVLKEQVSFESNINLNKEISLQISKKVITNEKEILNIKQSSVVPNIKSKALVKATSIVNGENNQKSEAESTSKNNLNFKENDKIKNMLAIKDRGDAKIEENSYLEEKAKKDAIIIEKNQTDLKLTDERTTQNLIYKEPSSNMNNSHKQTFFNTSEIKHTVSSKSIQNCSDSNKSKHKSADENNISKSKVKAYSEDEISGKQFYNSTKINNKCLRKDQNHNLNIFNRNGIAFQEFEKPEEVKKPSTKREINNSNTNKNVQQNNRYSGNINDSDVKGIYTKDKKDFKLTQNPKKLPYDCENIKESIPKENKKETSSFSSKKELLDKINVKTGNKVKVNSNSQEYIDKGLENSSKGNKRVEHYQEIKNNQKVKDIKVSENKCATDQSHNMNKITNKSIQCKDFNRNEQGNNCENNSLDNPNTYETLGTKKISENNRGNFVNHDQILDCKVLGARNTSPKSYRDALVSKNINK